MLVPVTILLPQEVALVLQRLENPSLQAVGINNKSAKVFQIPQAQTKVNATYNFKPSLLGGRTPSQLFYDLEEQQKSYSQVLSFDLARESPKASKKPTQRVQKEKKRVEENIQSKANFERKTKKQSKNIKSFTPRLFGKRTSSQLFSMSLYKRNENRRTDERQKPVSRESFARRLFGKRTPSQLFFMIRFQEIRSAPEASKKLGGAKNAPNKSQFVSRLFGKRTSSQLFRISKLLQRKNQLDYKPQSLRLAQRREKFIPRLLGQRTPSQLFLLANSKAQTKKQATQSKKRTQNKNPVYGTTGQHGYLTPSRLLNPYRVKREKYYTLGKGRMTPSALYLAYSRLHKNKPSLFGALTASQLLTVAKRQANRTLNERQFDAASSSPTVSQLGLSRSSSKAKAKPVAQPSIKLLKHLNQLPMEKSKKIDDALMGLTSSQLFLVADKKLKPQAKKRQETKNPRVYFNKKTSAAKNEAETTNLRPLLYGF